jgi:hypothetical protein
MSAGPQGETWQGRGVPARRRSLARDSLWQRAGAPRGQEEPVRRPAPGLGRPAPAVQTWGERGVNSIA